MTRVHRLLLHIYSFLLRMYPQDYRDQFGDEMTSVFAQASVDHWKQGWVACVGFVLRELGGMAAGAREARNAAFLVRDLAVDFSVPPELADAQRMVQYSMDQMQKAIAAHDFKKARFFSLTDERARMRVQRLRAKYGLPGS